MTDRNFTKELYYSYYENMNVEYNVIAIDDIKDLIAGLYQQSNEFLKRVQEFKDSADVLELCEELEKL